MEILLCSVPAWKSVSRTRVRTTWSHRRGGKDGMEGVRLVAGLAVAGIGKVSLTSTQRPDHPHSGIPTK